jgi:hypothetical protein
MPSRACHLPGHTVESSASVWHLAPESEIHQAILASQLEAEERASAEEEESRQLREVILASQQEAEEAERRSQEEEEQRRQEEDGARLERPMKPARVKKSSAGRRKKVLSLAETFGPDAELEDRSILRAYSLLDLNPRKGCNKLPSALRQAVLLMDPTMAFFLALAEMDSQQVKNQMATLKLEERELVLCPVNDCSDVGNADAGSHWALLVWERTPKSGRFTYYDSLDSESCLPQATPREASPKEDPEIDVKANHIATTIVATIAIIVRQHSITTSISN